MYGTGALPRHTRLFCVCLQQLGCDHSGKQLRGVCQRLPAGGLAPAQQYRAHRVDVRLDGGKDPGLQVGALQQRQGGPGQRLVSLQPSAELLRECRLPG